MDFGEKNGVKVVLELISGHLVPLLKIVCSISLKAIVSIFFKSLSISTINLGKKRAYYITDL